MNIYKLTHQRHIEYKLHTGEWITDDKLIGFFTTEEKASAAAEALRDKPGFCDYPTDFVVEKYSLPVDAVQGIYLVEHSYYLIDDRIDNIVEIGVFASEEEAMTAAAEYEKSSKFPVETHSWDEEFDIDNYLSVDKYEPDTAEWQDGFVLI